MGLPLFDKNIISKCPKSLSINVGKISKNSPGADSLSLP
jgi:hypothetical protein